MKRGVFLISLFGIFLFLMTAGAGLPAQDRKVAAFTLRTEIAGGRRVFVGVGGKIEGVVNPTLFVREWDVVEVKLVNGDDLNHHIAFPDFFILSEEVNTKGKSTTVTFVPFKPGGFVYYCLLDGHRALGMEGQMTVVANR